MTAPTPVEEALGDLLDKIKVGLLDNHLGTVFAALQERIEFRGKGEHWRLVWDGYKLDSPEVTMNEAVELENRLGVHWALLSPKNDAKTTIALIAICIQRAKGCSYPEAIKEAAQAPVEKVGDALSFYVGESPPFDGPSKTPSTASRSGTPGPPNRSARRARVKSPA